MELKSIMPTGLLCAFTLKLLAYGTSASECGVVAALCAVVFGIEYLSKSRRVQKIETDNRTFQDGLSKKIDDQVAIISKQNEVIKSLALELDQVRTSMSSVKMAAGFNPSVKRTG